MTRLLYFDTFNGVSGDMILGALIHLGLPIDHLEQELSKLDLDGYKLVAEEIERQGIQGINFRVLTGKSEHVSHGHHGDIHRGYQEICTLIGKSDLGAGIKARALSIFQRLGEAEAKVHGCSLESVHFHEVGAIDSIVDIVGACVGFEYLGVEHFYSGPLNLGGGTVTFSHGTWPVPAPATAELVTSFPTLVGTIQGELTTPTGAAVVTSLVSDPSPPPVSTYDKGGFGAGDKEFQGIPNMLRLLIGEELKCERYSLPQHGWQEEELCLLEANIDDMDGEMFGHFMERALSHGALDVYYTPVHMKKNRPGLMLSVLCQQKDREKMAELVFRETTTLGLRWSFSKRWSLERETKPIETEFGKVRVKVGRLKGEVIGITPEYEDMREVAAKAGISLRTLREKVLRQLRSKDYE